MWAALLDDMPLTALIRNLATMTRNGLLAPLSEAADKITIADPNDAGMLDVVGFDTTAPELISAFVRGEI